jgi:hypothetical protein
MQKETYMELISKQTKITDTLEYSDWPIQIET